LIAPFSHRNTATIRLDVVIKSRGTILHSQSLASQDHALTATGLELESSDQA
jgi:hypothetical protein